MLMSPELPSRGPQPTMNHLSDDNGPMPIYGISRLLKWGIVMWPRCFLNARLRPWVQALV